MATEYEKFLKEQRVRPLSDFKKIEESMDVLETGILGLDFAAGDLGPDGRLGVRARSIMEIVAPPNSGKSSAVIQFMKTTIDRYGDNSAVALYAEPPDFNTFEDKGLDPDRLVIRHCYDPDLEIKKNLAEDQLESMLAFAKRPEVKLIVIDSIAALLTTSQLFEGSGNSERDIEVNPVASLAKIFGNFVCRFLKYNHSAVLCMTNHYKETLNTSNIPIPSSDQIMTYGGRTKEFLARKRCLLRAYKKQIDKSAVHSVENTRSPNLIDTNFVMFKRKDGQPRSTRGILNMKDGSYNNEEKLIEIASFFGSRQKVKDTGTTVSELDPKVAQSGAWTYIGNEKFNGQDQAIEWLRQNPEVYEKLKYQVFQRHNQYCDDIYPEFGGDL